MSHMVKKRFAAPRRTPTMKQNVLNKIGIESVATIIPCQTSPEPATEEPDPETPLYPLGFGEGRRHMQGKGMSDGR